MAEVIQLHRIARSMNDARAIGPDPAIQRENLERFYSNRSVNPPSKLVDRVAKLVIVVLGIASVAMWVLS